MWSFCWTSNFLHHIIWSPMRQTHTLICIPSSLSLSLLNTAHITLFYVLYLLMNTHTHTPSPFTAVWGGGWFCWGTLRDSLAPPLCPPPPGAVLEWDEVFGTLSIASISMLTLSRMAHSSFLTSCTSLESKVGRGSLPWTGGRDGQNQDQW